MLFVLRAAGAGGHRRETKRSCLDAISVITGRPLPGVRAEAGGLGE
jgi:hypothetical protein